MEEQVTQAQMIKGLIQEVGVLKADCIYKDLIIQQLKQENQTLIQALEETTIKLEALKEVNTYTMNEEASMDDIEIDTCFVCD